MMLQKVQNQVLNPLTNYSDIMRMWNINPKILCRQHLLGEHVEMHMFEGTVKKGISIQGYIDKGLINPSEIKKRHNELVEEMKNRGFNHNSPIEINIKKKNPIDKDKSLSELLERCKKCKKRNDKYGKK